MIYIFIQNRDSTDSTHLSVPSLEAGVLGSSVSLSAQALMTSLPFAKFPKKEVCVRVRLLLPRPVPVVPLRPLLLPRFAPPPAPGSLDGHGDRRAQHETLQGALGSHSPQSTRTNTHSHNLNLNLKSFVCGIFALMAFIVVIVVSGLNDMRPPT